MASFEPASSIGGHYERLAKPSSREALLQISCSVCSEVAKEIGLRNGEERTRRDIEGVVSSAGC